MFSQLPTMHLRVGLLGSVSRDGNGAGWERVRYPIFISVKKIYQYIQT